MRGFMEIDKNGDGNGTTNLAPEYLALLQQYLEHQQQQQQQPQHHQHLHLHQAQPGPSRARLNVLIEQELARLADRPVAHKHPQLYDPAQAIPLEVEQYHVETSPRRPLQPAPPPPQHLYYPVEEQVAVTPQIHHQPQHVTPVPVHHHQQPAQAQHQVEVPQPQQQQLRYHQAIPIQYGYEDEQQIREQQQSPESIVRAQAQAEAQALAFQKVAQAAHTKHQDSALEQIRVANEKYRQQSALEQIRQGEAVSEAGRQERVRPKDPEGAYKAHLKAQATALVAEQRRAQEASEYKAHAEAILKLQAQQRAHLRAQEEAHKYALNFEKNQQRAQAHAQAVANAQALALYKARQQSLAKAQTEAKQAARAQAEARRIDPDSAPVVQYLLPNKVALPAPEVYLPKAAEALRAQAAQEKRLKKPQQPIKHILLEEIEPQLLRREPAGKPEEQQVTFLVDAGYYRKTQQPQRPLLRQPEYQGIEEVTGRPQHYPQQYHQQIESEKLALLVPVEHQSGP
ncbi:putative mediator of RNA polymerase II transcription subunit 26 [Copidosoma floridanum]|uniref:putative mediator of RNA polymerase II transcription subunit 26 n=1 Tax=Copidosoma floridanum TaxID=29053 RepID=UPI0006C9AC94|nr:putative mediator of RNA polymerase II transcription subunit 26 [Copidosoma floridanum]